MLEANLADHANPGALHGRVAHLGREQVKNLNAKRVAIISERAEPCQRLGVLLHKKTPKQFGLAGKVSVEPAPAQAHLHHDVLHGRIPVS